MQVNAIRTRILTEGSDVVFACFGDKYRQWNAAFYAGYATVLGKPVITLHYESLSQALKKLTERRSRLPRHQNKLSAR